MAQNLAKRIEWNEALHKFIQKLCNTKALIISMNLNLPHTDMDVHDPPSQVNVARFTSRERLEISKLLQLGFVEILRDVVPNKQLKVGVEPAGLCTRCKGSHDSAPFHSVLNRIGQPPRTIKHIRKRTTTTIRGIGGSRNHGLD